ncbi:unnamed protein product [Amoebophrya sp. A120]|nr:unnamed protein product [Amoebophrya sp. A120]|eukprot:GSA120T00006733001.1
MNLFGRGSSGSRDPTSASGSAVRAGGGHFLPVPSSNKGTKNRNGTAGGSAPSSGSSSSAHNRSSSYNAGGTTLTSSSSSSSFQLPAPLSGLFSSSTTSATTSSGASNFLSAISGGSGSSRNNGSGLHQTSSLGGGGAGPPSGGGGNLSGSYGEGTSSSPSDHHGAGGASNTTNQHGSTNNSGSSSALGGATSGELKDQPQTKEQMLTAMLERARYFANSQLAVQRVVFGKEITSLCYQMVSCETAYQHLIQPYLSKLAWDAEAEVRKQILLQFGDLAGFLIQSNPEVGYAYVLATLVPVFPTLLLDPVYKETRQDAAEALLVLSSHLRLQERTDYALRTVLSLSNDSDEEARAMSAFLLNGLAPTLTKELCVEFCAIQLIALGEDQKAAVRKAVLLNMKDVAHCAGEKFCGSRLFETFERLCEDVNYTVRRCGSEQLPLMIETSKKYPECIRIAKRLYNDQNRWVHLALCQNMGYILFALQKFGGKEAVDEADELIGYYFETLSTTGPSTSSAAGHGPANGANNAQHNEVRYHLAFTFSAVLEAILPLKPDRYAEFQSFFFSLCESKELRTRQAVACSLWKIGRCFNTEAEKLALVHGGGGGQGQTANGGDSSAEHDKDHNVQKKLDDGTSKGPDGADKAATKAKNVVENDLANTNENESNATISSCKTNDAGTSSSSKQANGKIDDSEPDQDPDVMVEGDIEQGIVPPLLEVGTSQTLTSAASNATAGLIATAERANPNALVLVTSLQGQDKIKPCSMEEKLIEQFRKFTQDRDDVKLGLAKHVGMFEVHPQYLMGLSHMMASTDNWRLRHLIATVSLPALCEKYTHDHNLVFVHLLPTYLKLLHDGVALVRSKAAAATHLVLKAVCEEARKHTSSSTTRGGGVNIPGGANASSPSPSKISAELSSSGESDHMTAGGPASSISSGDSPASVSSSRGGGGGNMIATNKFDPSPRTTMATTTMSVGSTPTGKGSSSTTTGQLHSAIQSGNKMNHFYNNKYFSLRTKRIVNHLRKTFKDGNFQNRITYLKMVDSLIRDNTVSRRFVSFFLTNLGDLAADKVRHVRLQWALLIGPHLKPGIGKCCHHRKLLAAGRSLQHSSDREVARALNFPIPTAPTHTTATFLDEDHEFSDTESLHFSTNSPTGSTISSRQEAALAGTTALSGTASLLAAAGTATGTTGSLSNIKEQQSSSASTQQPGAPGSVDENQEVASTPAVTSQGGDFPTRKADEDAARGGGAPPAPDLLLETDVEAASKEMKKMLLGVGSSTGASSSSAEDDEQNDDIGVVPASAMSTPAVDTEVSEHAVSARKIAAAELQEGAQSEQLSDALVVATKQNQAANKPTTPTAPPAIEKIADQQQQLPAQEQAEQFLTTRISSVSGEDAALEDEDEEDDAEEAKVIEEVFERSKMEAKIEIKSSGSDFEKIDQDHAPDLLAIRGQISSSPSSASRDLLFASSSSSSTSAAFSSSGSTAAPSDSTVPGTSAASQGAANSSSGRAGDVDVDEDEIAPSLIDAKTTTSEHQRRPVDSNALDSTLSNANDLDQGTTTEGRGGTVFTSSKTDQRQLDPGGATPGGPVILKTSAARSPALQSPSYLIPESKSNSTNSSNGTAAGGVLGTSAPSRRLMKQPYHIAPSTGSGTSVQVKGAALDDEMEAWPENIAPPLHEMNPQFTSALTVPDQPLPHSEYDEILRQKKESGEDD